MPPRLPLKSDFPSAPPLSIIPPTTGTPLNILILLHGLGDTHASFAQLGKNLNLPETCAISLQAPSPIPPLFTGSETPAFHWGDDVLFDEGKGDIDLDAGFKTSIKVIESVVSVLTSRCEYPPRNIVFYGFGQGAMAALAAAAVADVEFGGVVSVGGRLPSSVSSHGSSGKSKTSVLVCGGSRSSQVTRSAVDGLKSSFANVEYVKWEKSEDSMPKSREEMFPIMKFLARRLRSRAGVPEGAVEV